MEIHNCVSQNKPWDVKTTGTLFLQQQDMNNCGMFMMMAMFCICKGKNLTDCIWSLGSKNGKQENQHQMAVACSMVENDLNAFQFEDMKVEKHQAMIPGTITDKKGTQHGKSDVQQILML